MKKSNLFLILFISIILTYSCKKEENINQDTKGYYSCNYYLDNDLVSFSNSSDNLECTNFAVIGSKPGQIFGLSFMIGNFSNSMTPFTNCLKIELVNSLGARLENGKLNESQFDNLLSVRNIDFLDKSNYLNIEKEGVIITYYDKNGEIWTSSDFDNKFSEKLKVIPALDYTSFSFKIADSKKTSILVGKGYARKLKLLFTCELVNSQGLKRKLTFGNIDLIYQYLN